MLLRQLERDPPGPPPPLLPSRRGSLLAAQEASRTSIFPRSAPMTKKKSKIPLLSSLFFNYCYLVLYLTCFDLNPFLFRTLAQRAAKRAKASVIVIEDDPTMSAGGVSETTLTDPATTPQSSPQRSPQRKYMVYFSLTGAHGCSFFADILTVGFV